jgi:phosphoribosylamine---glycine ligase
MKILILGSGGREHALGWAIHQADPTVELLFCPGNGGTPALGRNLSESLENLPGLVTLARSVKPDLTLVGPEAPLVAGVVDRFASEGMPIFGPNARAAAIEGSKVFAKTLMRENGVPTPSFDVFASAGEARASAVKGLFPKVIKADGLAAGKGVVIARTREEAEGAIAEIMEGHRFGAAGDQVLIESYLEGEEVSAFALARGTEFRLLPLAQDHKRIGDGDTGPNTGGMGAYSPYLRATPQLVQAIEEEVFAPVLRALARGGRPYRGLLYAGIMIAHGRPSVLEFNCRFGDPETQAIAPLLGDGLLEALLAVATGEGELPAIVPAPAGAAARRAAATVVLASAGYPGSYRSGLPISGLDRAEELPETFVFHAGTRLDGRRLLTAGGRVLAVTGRGADLKEALRRAYEGCSLIEFEGKTFRRDIGRKGLS